MAISWDWLYDTVRKRFASEAEMEAFLPTCLNDDELRVKGDDRYLSAMSQRIFRAGMTHSVVDARWPAFEEALWGFVPEKMVLLTPEQIEAFAQDKRLIRHLTKMRTIPQNAQLILDVREAEGKSFGEFLADWPSSDIVGLWRWLDKRGTRLGGRSGAGFLRLAGKDTFLLTSDVVARLKADDVIDKTPTNQRDKQAVQDEFNRLQEVSGRPLCQLSSMLSLSINPRF